MPIQAISTKIISTLGNKESLLPIMIKDGVDSLSLTYKSFKEGGVIEGIDRATDEFGTQAIWIGGIPLFKKLADKTIYKKANINPNVDPRIISNKEYSLWAVKNAKGFMNNNKSQSVKSAIDDCLKDGGKLAGNLFITKIIAATILTLGSFFLLTKTKQNNTKHNVKKEMNNSLKNENSNKQNSPSFKGIASKITEGIMFNPVHNMKLIDAGITSERLLCSRNKVEFIEHAIKEGGFLFFIYGFGNLIEKGINTFSDKILKKPINLPIDVLTDKNLSDSLKNNTILKDIYKLPNQNKSLTEKLDFIINNPDNIVVKAAKSAKIISEVSDKAGKKFVDTSKYINIKEFNNLGENLKNLDKCYKMSNSATKSFINKLKYLKIASVSANIAISCLFLGYIIPKAIYKYRNIKTGTTKFHVTEDLKKTNNC